MDEQTRNTIADFSEQWVRYTTNDGFYGSLELFRDMCGPLLDIAAIRDARVCDVGSGTGRIVAMLIRAGARHVIAVEPSDAFEILEKNTREWADRIEYIKATGEAIPLDRDLDFVFSIGVLHHVNDPMPVVHAAYDALRPGGKLVVWLYGREGNESYLRLVGPLRRISVRLPPLALSSISHLLNAALSLYLPLCRVLPLPLAAYMNNVMGRFTWSKRHLVIYDQLNPRLARYYRREEAEELLVLGGFENVRLHHRHGYSWTVVGEKPLSNHARSG
jgi:SAM-dependent methyltransferase